MKTTIYLTHASLIRSSRTYEAIEALRRWMEWPEPECIVDPMQVVTITRGRFSPQNGMVMVMPDGQHVRNPVELAKWIDQQGLTPL